MKKTMVSLAAASLIATTAMAADKGIDIVTTGQATVYYETSDYAGDDLFNQSNNKNNTQTTANVGVQLNLDADLKNGFSFGSQLTYLGTAGLEKNLVGGTRQSVTDTAAMNDISDEIALTKIFVAKKIGNTTVKIGRQELPKSLSPLAFSEGWNVYKNTFEAILAINTDIPNTTLVGAYVGQSNNSKGPNFATFDDLTVKAGKDGINVAGTAYMLTAQTTAVPMATITASYYSLAQIQAATNEGANALWLDAKIAPKDLPMGLKFGLQGGSIAPEASDLKDTTAFGAKVGLSPVKALNVCLAYTSVDDGTVAIKNTGTGVKTPLYTQMILNQDAISLDADTFMLSAMYNFGDAGKVIARGSMTSAGKDNVVKNADGKAQDYTDLELIYKTKVGGTNLMAAYVNTKGADDDVAKHIIRVVARYNF